MSRHLTPLPESRALTAVSADGSRVHVEVYGPEGAPAVVLAHGWTCSIAFWAEQIRSLAADHRVIAYDQRGHGRSPAPGPGGYSTTALADDLEAVLAATLGPGERAVLAGHSMGGMTIMAAAGRPGLRQHAAAALLCSTGPSRLTAEATVVPLRPGALRSRLTAAVLGAKAPLGPVNAVSKKVLKYATMGPGAAPDRVEACARIVHACPRGARHGWSQVLAGLDLEPGVRELRLPGATRRPAHPGRPLPRHGRGPPALHGPRRTPRHGPHDPGGGPGGRHRTDPRTDPDVPGRQGDRGGRGMSRVSLEGQVAVVTGGARGVGELLARKLSARGAKIALVGLEPEQLKEVAGRLHTEADWWHADVTDHEAMAKVAAEVKERFGKVDIVVANAGVAAGGPFVESDPGAWRRVIEVNLIGGAVTGRAFLPVLMESRGYFLQIASLAALTPAPMMTAYCASKSGVEAFAHSLRAEVAYKGVKVGVGYLSWTDTDMVRGADQDDVMKELRQRLPARPGRRPDRRGHRAALRPCVRAVVAARDAVGPRLPARHDRDRRTARDAALRAAARLGLQGARGRRGRGRRAGADGGDRRAVAVRD